MRKVIDITGIINKGMWNYGALFPEIDIEPLSSIPQLDGKTVGCEIFEGLHIQSKTYLETPAHELGNGNSYALIEVPVEKLIDISCVVLNVGLQDIDTVVGLKPITVRDLENCSNVDEIQEGDAILIGTG